MTPNGPGPRARFTTSYWPADVTSPLRDMTVGDLLAEAAADAPDRLALVEGHPDPSRRRRWTYAELAAEAERVARALASRFAPGERVAVWAHNVPEWLLLELGAAQAGVVLVTANPALRRDEIRYVLEQSRAAGVVHAEEYRGNPMASIVAELAPQLHDLREVIGLSQWDELLATAPGEAELPAVDPLDPVQIQYTSGTTGFPKGAVLHHRGIVNNARFIAERTGLAAGSTWTNPMPLFHTGGCVIAALGALWNRGTHVLVPWFDPALVLELVESERADHVGGVPTMLLAMLAHPDMASRDVSSVKCVVSGGSTVPADVVRRTEAAFGASLVIVFGQTELAPVVTMTRPDDDPLDKAETIGQPLPQVEVKVADPSTGESLPPGAQGEICARGYQQMIGYFEMPEATAETVDADGWLHTGDLGTMDERGYFRITGRLRDMIIRGGENIYPREIEERLIVHPAVQDVAVIGVPDEAWGERVAAVLQLGPGDPPQPGELRSWCRESLAPHKTPVDWFVVDSFPLTGSGKVQKFVLRDLAAAGSLQPLEQQAAP